ncbi:hypothetical protein GW17_00041182 [Ensete ventricosum]|nr:hypothetical protein GW17_00041182 [Ensete ventricosum]
MPRGSRTHLGRGLSYWWISSGSHTVFTSTKRRLAHAPDPAGPTWIDEPTSEGPSRERRCLPPRSIGAWAGLSRPRGFVEA